MPAQPLLQKTAPHHAPAYHVAGMHGLGDSLHQRAVVRQLMQQRAVWLETSWPFAYHDLVGPRLHLVHKASPVGVYKRNAERERTNGRYSTVPVPRGAWPTKISYSAPLVRSTGSVVAAMCRFCNLNAAQADFRLPVHPEWTQAADALIAQWQPAMPLLIYRPLVQRSWWGGCRTRNPDHAAYAALLSSIRERFFVVSVAEVEPGVEWIVGEPIDADVTLHAGELAIETLAALVQRAALVFTSPGFAVILAQAVGTPSAVVFGGFEDGRSFSFGARFAPYLPIEPMNPCACWSHQHGCDKRMDVAAAVEKLRAFVELTSAVAPG